MRPMKRTNVYLTEKQLERLRNQAEKESVAVAEIIRRSVEVYLAWNDPTYNCATESHPPTRHN
jgi:ribbon-helix-helix protein